MSSRELTLQGEAAHCLAADTIDEKCEATARTARLWRDGGLVLDETGVPAPIAEAGRPVRPHLVAPKELPLRKPSSPKGRAALIHALAHIEFNAINLAWDAVYRFRGMPRAFYDDWVRVADEEALHFGLLRTRLHALGYDYGDFDAHNGLWEMAQKTADDVLVRMALVPRVLEARGLDVAPAITHRLQQAGDAETVAALEVIMRDEVGHVQIGTRWYRHLCSSRGVDPEATYEHLLRAYMQGRIKGPFNLEARKRAGFSDAEIALIERLDSDNR